MSTVKFKANLGYTNFREKLGSTHCVIPALGEQEGNLVYMAGSRSEKGIPGTRGKPDSNRKLTER